MTATIVKRHHDYNNSEEISFNGYLLTVLEINPLPSWWVARGMQAGIVLESSWESTDRSYRQSRATERCWDWTQFLRSQAYCHWHTFSSKATPTSTKPHLPIPHNRVTPWWLSFKIYELVGNHSYPYYHDSPASTLNKQSEAYFKFIHLLLRENTTTQWENCGNIMYTYNKNKMK